MTKHLFSYFNEIFPAYWEQSALEDYKGTVSYTYGEMAEQAARIGVMCEAMGIKPGDKVAICGRNSSNWAVAYLGITLYGGVIVSILQDFSGKDIQQLVNHSDATLFFVGPYMQKVLDMTTMPNLKAAISLTDFSLIYAPEQEKTTAQLARVDTLFAEKYPNGFGKDNIHYRTDNIDDLMLINYTSGSTGSPKGVMLTYRSLSNNVANAIHVLPNKPGEKIVSMLPLAHMYGQLGEFLYQIATGCHVYFLTKSPTPTILLKAMQDVHPYIVITVPLVIEKIYKSKIYPVISKSFFRKMWNKPIIGKFIHNKIRKSLLKAFGGNVRYFLLGGAALNPDVEKCLMDIHFPISIGYGMTECGPLISGRSCETFVYRSGGQILPGMEAMIDDPNPETGVGEIMVRGENTMIGYYKNEEATKAIFTEDGWMHTGDLGYIDNDKNIFIKGRNKTMILGASGQNIYPEEIEDKLNNQQGVIESVVVEREGKLIGLVFPDGNAETEERSLTDIMKENLEKLNKLLPRYSQLSKIEIVKKEFEKTPKKSIKRFLYK